MLSPSRVSILHVTLRLSAILLLQADADVLRDLYLHRDLQAVQVHQSSVEEKHWRDVQTYLRVSLYASLVCEIKQDWGLGLTLLCVNVTWTATCYHELQ